MHITKYAAAVAAQDGIDREPIEAELLKRFASGEDFDLTETRWGDARAGYATRTVEGGGRLLVRYRLVAIGPGIRHTEARRVLAVQEAED